MKKEYLLFKSSNYALERTNYDLLNYTDIFDEIKLLTENDLDDYIKNIINNIIEKYGNRGYGYWIWKPYLILQELNNMEDGDILVYTNIHAKLNNVKQYFKNIWDDLINTKFPIFLGDSGCCEKTWTSSALIKYIEDKLEYKFSIEELNANQYGAGTICILKNKFSTEFVKTWLDLMINGIEYITDIYNKDINNDQSFKENRHDQSVCSLLYKYYKLNKNEYVNIINSAENNI